jgi:hypothetical protein
MPDTGFKYEVDLHQLDWSQVQWRSSLRRVPAVVFLLLTGVLAGQPAAGVLSAAAAFSVGIAGTRKVRNSRLLAMVWTTGCMAASATLGSLAGNVYGDVLLAALTWGFVCGLLTVFQEDLGWIAMQSAIALLVATAFPSAGFYALGRGLLVMVGGFTQILCLLLLWRVEEVSRFGDETAPKGTTFPVPPSVSEVWTKFRGSLVFTSTAFRYALRVGLTLVIALELDHLLALKNGYWLPMTTLIILKPDFYRTYAGGIQRVLGTLAGVIAASLIAMVLRPHAFALVALVGIFGLLSNAFLKANPVIFSAALTSFVVFLIAVTGYPEADVTWHRLINTALGCALALTSRFIGFNFFRPRVPEAAHG